MSNPSLQSAEMHAEAAAENPVEGRVEAGKSDADAQLRELQILLFGSERQQLNKLQLEWNDPDSLTPKVSQVLPEAIAQRSGEDYQLTQAMTPYVVESIKNAARHNPEYISEAIFPILGPAIRRAIAQAFNNLTQTINQTLQHSFTVRGLRWRMEAIASGKSFAEVVLYHSLLYRIEQIFLIHRQTGLVLVHAAATSVEAQDADIVSGMLTAIQDFIKDSFGAGENEGVEAMQVGDVNILVEQGPRALLACVIRGSVPSELREELQETLEQIHRERGAKLEAFNGDTTAFEGCRPLLESHLQSRYQPFAEPGKATLPTPALIVGVVLLGALVIWGGLLIRDRFRWNAWVEKLQATPGIVITEQEKGWRNYRIAGLRDPLAPDPQSLLSETGLSAERVQSRWEEFHSPAQALARAKNLLHLPTGVTLQIRDGILLVNGAVTQQWLTEAKKFAPFIPGISEIQVVGAGELTTLQKQIESQAVRYVDSAAAPGQEQLLDNIVQQIRALDSAAGQVGKKITINIAGHTDSSGTPEQNDALGQQRAKNMESWLREHAGNLSNTSFATSGINDSELVVGSKEATRRVTFKVEIST